MAILKVTAQRMCSDFKLCLICTTALVIFRLTGTAQSRSVVPSKEYQVKAIFLFNFTQFVEWPAHAFANNTPLIIGILGKNPFGNYLNDAIQGEKVNNRPIILEYFSDAEKVENCHILFINLQKSAEIKAALAALKGRSILTVSDANNFTRYGGIIQFFTSNGKIKIRINIDAATDADLTISSKLLHVAE